MKESSSPYINRFLSADMIVPNPANPQSLNRYSYVVNNPLRYIDPTGHMFTDGQCGYQGQDCGGYLGGTGGGVGNGDNGGDDDDEEDESPTPPSTHGGGSQPLLSPEPAPADGISNDHYCVAHPYACNGTMLTATSSFTQGSPENSPNPSVGALIVIGVLLTGAIVVSEIGLVWAEINFAPLVAVNPLVGVPLELVLVSASLALIDVDVAYWSYTYRVQKNPDVKQDFEILPPWGL